MSKPIEDTKTEANKTEPSHIEFGMGSVPVKLVAEIYGKDACWVRAGIITGYLPIGTATRKGKVITSLDQMNSKYGHINYYISPKKLYEETGYIWKGKPKTKKKTSERSE